MAEELRNKLEKAELWKGMEDDSDGYMTGEEMCKLEDGLLQAYIDDKAGQEAAAVPSATMESQAPWGWGESLAQPSLMDTEGEHRRRFTTWCHGRCLGTCVLCCSTMSLRQPCRRVSMQESLGV